MSSDFVPSKGIGGHHSAAGGTDDWITPPEIIKALGPFDLDPCASDNQPWSTAKVHYTVNGLSTAWPSLSRVWLNPPYGLKSRPWLERMVEHNNGIALLFARTETDMFHRYVWPHADGMLFIRGRLTFYNSAGMRAQRNAGGPSVLVAYGEKNLMALEKSQIPGFLIWGGGVTVTGHGITELSKGK